jgi:hypothetical protein
MGVGDKGFYKVVCDDEVYFKHDSLFNVKLWAKRFCNHEECGGNVRIERINFNTFRDNLGGK